MEIINKEIMSFMGDTNKYIKKVVISKWLSTICYIFFAYGIAFIWEDVLIENEFKVSKFILVTLLTITVIILRRYFINNASRESNIVVGEVKYNLRRALFNKVLNLEEKYKDSFTRSEILQISVEAVESLETFFGGFLPQLKYCFLVVITLFIALIPFAWGTGILLLITAPVIPIILLLIIKMTRNVNTTYWNSYADVGKLFLDSIQGLTTLKIFGSDKNRAEEIDIKTEKFRVKTMKLLVMQLGTMVIINGISYGVTAGGIFIALRQFRNGSIGVFGVLLSLILVPEFFLPMMRLTSLFHVAMTGVSVSDKMVDFLNMEEPISGKNIFDSKDIDINVGNLYYSYDKDIKVLNNINMRICNKSLTAIVGSSGCGKSTLAAILSSKIDDYSGNVFLNDLNIKSIDKDSIYRNICVVNHDSYIFGGTVKDNLLMGNSLVSEQQMISVLTKVNLWGYLKEENGLYTKVQTKGSNFSGGQRQRLALARALLLDCSVYIFDEITSNVDVESENIIMDIIHTLSLSKTVILISHRLKTVENANEIIVMKNGVVFEKGSHDELMKNDELYKSMYLEQVGLESYRREDI